MAIPDKEHRNSKGENDIKRGSGPAEDPSQPNDASKENNKNSVGSADLSAQLHEFKTTDGTPEEKPAYIEELELDVDHAAEWLKQFTWLKILLIIFGRWPITYSEDTQKRAHIFRFSWTCPGFVIFILTAIFTIYGLIASSVNVIDILITDKVKEKSDKTKTEIIEQGLAERHTTVLIIILGTYGINTLTLIFIFIKRHEISDTFTKWTQFLNSSKLNGGSAKTNMYVGVALGNYIIVTTVYVGLTVLRKSATFIGGPTVVAILFTRNFLPADYLEKNYVESDYHKTMHVMGLVIYFHVVTACNMYMYLFLWLLKSLEKVFYSWNLRMTWVVESASAPVQSAPAPGDDEEENKPRTSRPSISKLHPKLTYHALYDDHIGLVRILSWVNSIFAFTSEPYVLFLIVRVVYQIYLGAIVMKSHGEVLNQANVGKYFIRKDDHIPAFLLTYENSFMLLIILLACSWLEDTAYDSYDILRKNSLLKGTSSDKESFFFLSMFQSYISTTKMAIYGAQYFCVDRYTILHVLSAIMSNFLVVYQFEPLFDLDTSFESQGEILRETMGKFLESFEGLPPNHTLPK